MSFLSSLLWFSLVLYLLRRYKKDIDSLIRMLGKYLRISVNREILELEQKKYAWDRSVLYKKEVIPGHGGLFGSVPAQDATIGKSGKIDISENQQVRDSTGGIGIRVADADMVQGFLKMYKTKTEDCTTDSTNCIGGKDKDKNVGDGISLNSMSHPTKDGDYEKLKSIPEDSYVIPGKEDVNSDSLEEVEIEIKDEEESKC